jgi:molecular chaperone HtpG
MTGDEKEDARLIGQFGVGFYSAFIVADRVVVETRRAGLQAGEGVRWESDGQGEFTVETAEIENRGTRVTLHLKDGESEFAEPMRLENLIHKYSDHIAFPVTLAGAGEGSEDKVVNSATALWTRPRSDISDEEYKEFYKHLSHDFADPLRWSHNQVEGKREYTSLLYIPANAPFDLWNREAPRGLKLYVQRVFIMDPDLQAMRGALTRRVLDMLAKMAAGEGDDYGNFWRQFGPVMKEGLIEDPGNKEKLSRLLRFATTHGKGVDQDQSLDDYVSRMQDGQDRIYYLLADNHSTAIASPHLEQLRNKDIEVLLLTDRIDPWLVDALREYDGKELADVAREDVSLPEGDGVIAQDVANEQHKPLLKKIKRVLKDRVEAVNVSRRLVDSPACVVAGEGDLNPSLKRMLEASGQSLPETRPILEVNVEHPLVERLSAESDEERFSALSNVLLDHALLAEGSQIENPAEYVARMNRLLLELDSATGAK